MNKIQQYLTVKELADIMGVSVQAIYKRISKDFQPYVVEVDNKKCFKSSILKHLSDNHSTEKVESSIELNILKRMVEILEKENEYKQELINRLEVRNFEEHKHLMELTDKVGTTLQTLTQRQLADKLVESQQILTSTTTEKKKHWLWGKK